jgi:hypothetical protein
MGNHPEATGDDLPPSDALGTFTTPACMMFFKSILLAAGPTAASYPRWKLGVWAGVLKL